MISPHSLLAPESAVVFLFHGVLREPRDTGVRNYTGKHVPLAAFEAFLDELLDAGRPLTIDEVAAGVRGARALPDRAFAVTFDDGFANNLVVAAPALEARGIPAAVYVTTDFVDRQLCSWIDMIEYAVDRADGVTLSLPFLEATLGSREEKIAALDRIRRQAKSDAGIDPYELAQDVMGQLGIAEFAPDHELDRKLTWEQVRTLAAHPLFTVGAHGATHRILSHVGPGQVEREVDGSLERLDAEIGRPTLHFSYPEGGADTYTDEIVDRLRLRGVSSAVVVGQGAVRRGDDPFALPRVLVA